MTWMIWNKKIALVKFKSLIIPVLFLWICGHQYYIYKTIYNLVENIAKCMLNYELLNVLREFVNVFGHVALRFFLHALHICRIYTP